MNKRLSAQKKVRPVKYVFVTGGVMSSLGKGIASASLGLLLESRGLTIGVQKLDPYINVDPGTMNPYEHGEVFVTDDGAETDLDLGHYQRFTKAELTRACNFTSGTVYHSVITKERKGEFLGKTVQVIPHITDEIKSRIKSLGNSGEKDVVIVEIGGTVGDIESLPFLEAVRQLRSELGRENTIFIHLTYVPYVAASGEFKTKPTQHSVKELLKIGIQPDVLLCRTEEQIPDEIKRKIALFCNVDFNSVVSGKDVNSVYEVPLVLHGEGLDETVATHLNIWTRNPRLTGWRKMFESISDMSKTVTIAVVGKYVGQSDTYKSLHEALVHGGMANGCEVNIKYIDSAEIKNESSPLLKGADGILVPGGFGERGYEGKIKAIARARKNNIPFFGICLGMQMAVVEFARGVCGMKKAHSSEMNAHSPYPVINFMSGQKDIEKKGGTMRLGAFPCVLRNGTRAHKAYGKKRISERHRHRLEFNNDFLSELKAGGLVASGESPDSSLVEIVELKKHPWFVGCQFHPEFLSTPLCPHPLFRDFIGAALNFRKSK
ncbi:CTP synthase [Candidatus Mycalebacterium sp.]